MSQIVPFHPAITRWFDAHFAHPSPPQAQGWPAIAAGRHTLILAPTGSGKTLAAFLWCLNELFEQGLVTDTRAFARNAAGVHTLYVSPLKALNNDIHRNLQAPLQGIAAAARELGLVPPRVHVMVRTGDTPPHLRRAMLRHPPHLLITTPESLYLLLTSAQGREVFRHLRYLIVDEIHAVSNNKRGVHLSLSLERLMALCAREPVRIGLSATQRPLQRIAAFLGGQRQAGAGGPLEPRPVTMVDCGQRKEMDLQVLAPVPDFGDLPAATVWPAVVHKLYDLIGMHRTTLVFVNLRAQTERLARLLNEKHREVTGDPEAELALAHHGSLSREARYAIEDRLKRGEIAAVIATAALELGIDIGSVDLVVQLESPRSVSSGLQRVGRSGHLLSAASKGRVMPLYPADLDDAVSLTRSMLHAEIEESVVPENCLDVLAQHLVAEVAMQEWSRPELYRLVRQSYCYRNLTPAVFDSVLEMLSGRFASTELRPLQPRLTWDKVNDRLLARRGARMQAVMSGGTIPDRGYYSVYLADSNVKLGEMEEEFVFESRVGNVFYLGNNEWRIDQILQDRIVVTPVRAVKPRPPFWKGDALYRDHATSARIAAFRRELLEKIERGEGEAWLHRDCHADADTARNLQDYLVRQRDHTGVVPTDRQFVGEWFRDSANEPHFMLHACCGARVNGAWALALATALEQRYRAQVQYAFNDDGLVLRLLDTAAPPPLAELLTLPGGEIENLIMAALRDAPLFAVRFRYNCTTALLLPRSRHGKRIPLWLQRLRAADLLQAVRQFPDFPMLLETLRDCLQEVFDLAGLRQVLEKLQRGDIQIHFVETPFPSPMASGLMFQFLANNLYGVDRAHYPAAVGEVSSTLLAEVLTREDLPAIVTPDLVAEAEARWQHTSGTPAATAEDLYALIEKLGPISTLQLHQRSRQDPAPWLRELRAAGRVQERQHPPAGWLVAEAAARLEQGSAREQALLLVRHFLRLHGPATAAEIAAAVAQEEALVHELLVGLHGERQVVRGRLVQGVVEEQWCDRYNFAELYRRAIAVRRASEAPLARPAFYRFLLRWHKLGMPGQALCELAGRYSGVRLPLHFFERELLRTRLAAQAAERLAEVGAEWHALLAQGEIIVQAGHEGGEGRRHVRFLRRGEGSLFAPREELLAAAAALEEPARSVYEFLRENGASPWRDLVAGTNLGTTRVEVGLANLALAGLASCDNYTAFLHLVQPATTRKNAEPEREALPVPPPAWQTRERLRRERYALRAALRERMPLQEGRWFLTSSFGVMGRDMTPEVRAERQARLLLQRHGVVVKDWYRRESGLLPWPRLFHVLKRLEWQGEVRRGYFIAGLSGIQFALPEAVELLHTLQMETSPAPLPGLLVSTADPCLPFGEAVPWNLRAAGGSQVAMVRGAGNHLLFVHEQPVVYSENYGNRLWLLEGFHDDHAGVLADCLKNWLQLPAAIRPRSRLEVLLVDQAPAATSALAERLRHNGFEQEGDKLVLWPSGV